VKGLRSTLISILAIGLLAGSAVGVVAQDEATDPAAPVEFTAKWGFSPGCCSTLEPASDPRFVGDVDATFSADEYLVEGTLRVASRAFHVENDEGAWRGVPLPVLFFPDATASGATQAFVGEGGYAGSYAVADITTIPGSGVVLHGFIFEGEPPAALAE
jgi:hypothetical protein